MIEAPLPTWIALGGLLAASGFFSSSETALFALEEAERPRAGAAAERVLRDPQGLLVTLIAGNLVVNVAYFALVAGFVRTSASYESVLVALVALVAIILFGELLPKAVALRARESVARANAPLVVPLVAGSGPLRRAMGWSLDLVRRALGDAAREESGVSAESLAEVLENSARGGLIEAREADMLAEVVELEGIRVREIMTPRVDMIALDLSDEDEEHRWFQLARALAKRSTWMPVLRGGADDVVGQVHLRDVLAAPERSIESLVKPVVFVPAVASVLDLLNVLRERKAAEAVVVDEYGGTAGIVTVENVFEEIVGDLKVEGERDEPLVTQLADGHFRVSGSLSIRDWNERFGREIFPEGFETVGGFVTAHLGRIPREGDRVATGGLVSVVRAVRGRRVESVEMFVEEREDER